MVNTRHLYQWTMPQSRTRRPCALCGAPSWGVHVDAEAMTEPVTAYCERHMTEKYPLLMLDAVVNG